MSLLKPVRHVEMSNMRSVIRILPFFKPVVGKDLEKSTVAGRSVRKRPLHVTDT